VVDFGLGGGAGAAGEGAAAVPCEQCFALAGCGQALASAVAEDATCVVEDRGQHLTVTGQLERVGDAEGAAMVGGGPSGPAFQVGQREGDDQLRGQAGVIRQLTGLEQPAAGFLERVVQSLARGAVIGAERVVRSAGCERGEHGFPDRLAGRGGCPSNRPTESA
jgi:hypothetical protein